MKGSAPGAVLALALPVALATSIGAPAASIAPLATTAKEPAIHLRFVPAPEPQLDEVRAFIEREGGYEELIADINAVFAVPDDLLVSFQSGDGPLWDPNERVIVMSYEFFDLVAALVLEAEPNLDEESFAIFVLDTIDFVLFHELGHAFIEVLGLPVVGREEDAVDSLGAVLAAEFLEDAEAALGGAIAFDLLAAQSGALDDSDFWDDHSLGEQRYFAIVCWVYGSDPESFAYLVEDGWLPEERAPACPAEYEQQARSWAALLGDSIR